MTNEELKKKIVEVLKKTINWTTDYSIPIGIVYKSELDNIADALIAAGLCDKNTLDEKYQTLMAAGFVQLASLRLDLEKVLHRAEVAEQKYKLLFQKYDSFFNDVTYCHKNFSDVDSEITKQAEKELAEEETNNVV